jgi:hypothetical protein
MLLTSGRVDSTRRTPMNAETENGTEVSPAVGGESDPPTEAENGLAADADTRAGADGRASADAEAGADGRADADGGAGIAAEERRIIGDAVARGSTVTRWIAMIIGVLFIASGLWWAGILVAVVTTFELPRVAAQSYARKRGVQMNVPSATEVEKTSLTGLLIGVVFLPVVCALVLTEMTLGHPLLPWSWTTPFGEDPDPYVILPLAVCALAITVIWVVRRLTDSRQTRDAIDSQKGSE